MTAERQPGTVAATTEDGGMPHGVVPQQAALALRLLLTGEAR